MMRIALMSLVVLVLGGGPVNAKESAIVNFSGTLESVDVASNKLRVKDSKGAGEVKEFSAVGVKRIKKGRNKATLADLTVGDEVFVRINKGKISSIEAVSRKAK